MVEISTLLLGFSIGFGRKSLAQMTGSARGRSIALGWWGRAFVNSTCSMVSFSTRCGGRSRWARYTELLCPQTSFGFAPDHAETEKLIVASGADHTILRNNLYADLLLMAGAQSIALGQHFAAAADGKTGYVTRADCARAAAAALMTGRGKQTLDITGPAAVSQAEIAEILSGIAGKQISYVALPSEDLVQAMIANGLPEFMARVFVSFDEAIAQGYLDVASADLNALTGQPGQSVRDFLLANRAALLRSQG